ncbi:MAG TPA: hypothetical protein DCS66_16885 [Flavobacteriaceae bacterium]|nr:hypothetical protein [Flavobacteriaceae bacterium]
MLDITVFILKNKFHTEKRTISHNHHTLINCHDAIKIEIDQYKINGEIHVIDTENIPCRCQSNLICFLDQNTFIPADFLNRVVSLNNLFRDGGVFCGPVYTKWEGKPSGFAKSIEKNYHKYDLHFGNSQVCDITGEEHNYPSLIGSVISGGAYNEIGYFPVSSPRHTSGDNKGFIQKISQKYKIIYSIGLFKTKYLTSFDAEVSTLSDYYYDLGYQDGILLANKNLKDRHEELWHRFVNSPELLDNEMPRWLYDDKVETHGSYLETLVVLKCKYQIGLYEGMMGQKLI